MPRWRCEAERLLASELGTTDLSWTEWDAACAPKLGSGSPTVLSAVGHAPSSVDRIRLLAALAASVPVGGRLVVADHNRPRRLARAIAAVLGSPRVPGWSPATRWRRLAYPTAREVQAAGFGVERLRLVAGERVQVVIATRGDALDGTQRSCGPKNGS